MRGGRNEAEAPICEGDTIRLTPPFNKGDAIERKLLFDKGDTIEQKSPFARGEANAPLILRGDARQRGGGIVQNKKKTPPKRSFRCAYSGGFMRSHIRSNALERGNAAKIMTIK